MASSVTVTKCPHLNARLEALRKERGLASRSTAMEQVLHLGFAVLDQQRAIELQAQQQNK